MNIEFFSRNAKNVLLEAEINPSRIEAFIIKYNEITGQQPSKDGHLQTQENKWGAEYRIYFNCDSDINDEFLNLGLNVEQGSRPYREQWRFRVNNMEFFWSLVNAGYRLGKN